VETFLQGGGLLLTWCQVTGEERYTPTEAVVVEGRRGDLDGEYLTFIQANLQHSIAASRILARMVSGKGIDMALMQELWYHENCIRGLNIPGYTLYSAGGDRQAQGVCLGEMRVQ
jgi:hypothetical protein